MVLMGCWSPTSPAIIAKTQIILKTTLSNYTIRLCMKCSCKSRQQVPSWHPKRILGLTSPKIGSPQILDQSEGDKVCGPDQFGQMTGNRIVELIESISSQDVSAQIKFKVMQRAVATCPKVNMGCGRKRILSLLDSGSQGTLIHQSYFKWEILHHIIPSSGEKAEAHQLFQLTAANNGKLPISMCVELDLNFLGIVAPKVGVLITKNPMNYWMNAIKPNCLAPSAGI